MLRLFYQDGRVEEFEGGKSDLTKTPKQTRRWAVALVTGVTANQDLHKTQYWSIDENGVESCETFFNRDNVRF